MANTATTRLSLRTTRSIAGTTFGATPSIHTIFVVGTTLIDANLSVIATSIGYTLLGATTTDRIILAGLCNGATRTRDTLSHTLPTHGTTTPTVVVVGL